jgi:hypothetical protein
MLGFGINATHSVGSAFARVALVASSRFPSVSLVTHDSSSHNRGGGGGSVVGASVVSTIVAILAVTLFLPGSGGSAGSIGVGASLGSSPISSSLSRRGTCSGRTT